MARRTKPAEVPEHPGPQHNNPPEPVETASLASSAEQWAEYMGRVFADVSTKLAALLDMDARFKRDYPLAPPAVAGGSPIGIEKWSDDIQSRAASMREKFRDISKMIENLHAIEKQPILAATRAIDGSKNTILQKIEVTDSKGRLIKGADAPMNRIRDRCTLYAEWVDAERSRVQREEADQKQRKAEEAAAEATRTSRPEAFERAAEAFGEAEQAAQAVTAPSADRTRVYGAVGGVMSLGGRWTFFEAESKLLDLVKAVAEGKEKIEYLAFNSSRIGYAVRSEKIREITGCVIREDRSV